MAMLVRAVSLWRLLLAFEVGSLELGGFLAEVESGRFGVEVLELCPKLWWGLHLPLEHLVLGDSTAMSGAAALGGDFLDASDSLACWYDGASGMGISPWYAGR